MRQLNKTLLSIQQKANYIESSLCLLNTKQTPPLPHPEIPETNSPHLKIDHPSPRRKFSSSANHPKMKGPMLTVSFREGSTILNCTCSSLSRKCVWSSHRSQSIALPPSRHRAYARRFRGTVAGIFHLRLWQKRLSHQ